MLRRQEAHEDEAMGWTASLSCGRTYAVLEAEGDEGGDGHPQARELAPRALVAKRKRGENNSRQKQ